MVSRRLRLLVGAEGRDSCDTQPAVRDGGSPCENVLWTSVRHRNQTHSIRRAWGECSLKGMRRSDVRLGRWHAEARGILESLLGTNAFIDQRLGERIRSCLDREPLSGRGFEQ